MGRNGNLYWPQRHHVPRQRFVAGAAFRLKGQRMADLLRGQRKAQRHAVLRVAVDAVGVDLPSSASAMASGQGLPASCVPWSHIIMGKSTRTPRR